MKKYVMLIFNIIMSLNMLLCNPIEVYARSNSKSNEFMKNHSEILKLITEYNFYETENNEGIDKFLEEVLYYNNIEREMCKNIINYSDDINIINLAQKITKGSQKKDYIIQQCIDKDKTFDETNINNLNKKIKIYRKEMIFELQLKREGYNINKIFLNSLIKNLEYINRVLNTLCIYTNDEYLVLNIEELEDQINYEINILKDEYNYI